MSKIEQAKSLTDHPLFNFSGFDSIQDQAETWIALDFIEKYCKAKKESLRTGLLTSAMETGTANAKGNQELVTEAGTIIRERREAKVPNPEELMELVQKSDLSPTQVFDEVTSFEVNPSKVEFLINTGALKEEEVSEMKKVTWALKIAPSKKIKALLK